MGGKVIFGSSDKFYHLAAEGELIARVPATTRGGRPGEIAKTCTLDHCIEGWEPPWNRLSWVRVSYGVEPALQFCRMTLRRRIHETRSLVQQLVANSAAKAAPGAEKAVG